MRKTILSLIGIFILARCASNDPDPSQETLAPIAVESQTVAEFALTFHCAFDDTCPEVMIARDPQATLGDAPAPFRGYGDPSLEYDPDEGALWLSYSWLDTLVSDFGPPPVVDFGVRTHLARSEDGGRSFIFVGAINEAEAQPLPNSEGEGWTTNEVSTLLLEPDGDWQMMWLSYLNPLGDSSDSPVERVGVHYVRARGNSPVDLGANAVPWIGGEGLDATLGAQHNLSVELPELEDCVAFTEPALFSDGEGVYLATGCIVFEGGARREEQERIVLLRETATGYEYVGALLDGKDAAHLGADKLEQADLAYSRDGAILLIVTPIITGGEPQHQGCVVFEVADLANAQVRRDESGHALPRAIITADGNGLGPGLCTYDPASETGVLLVITTFDLESTPIDIVFSLRATGIHP